MAHKGSSGKGTHASVSGSDELHPTMDGLLNFYGKKTPAPADSRGSGSQKTGKSVGETALDFVGATGSVLAAMTLGSSFSEGVKEIAREVKKGLVGEKINPSSTPFHDEHGKHSVSKGSILRQERGVRSGLIRSYNTEPSVAQGDPKAAWGPPSSGGY